MSSRKNHPYLDSCRSTSRSNIVKVCLGLAIFPNGSTYCYKTFKRVRNFVSAIPTLVIREIKQNIGNVGDESLLLLSYLVIEEKVFSRRRRVEVIVRIRGPGEGPVTKG